MLDSKTCFNINKKNGRTLNNVINGVLNNRITSIIKISEVFYMVNSYISFSPIPKISIVLKLFKRSHFGWFKMHKKFLLKCQLIGA